jgi:small-conductance mechanosensitive channel
MSFWDQHGDLISAAITMLVTFAIAAAVDRFVIARAGRIAGRAELTVSRATQTRLRLVRRIVFVVIVLIGASIALSYVHKLERLTTGILASSAVLGLVMGLAARQVLANPLAGILLAITQPIRIGDTVTVEDETGRVDDLTLSYTFLDTGDGRLMVIPNEIVVTSIVFNRSTGDRTAPATASIWVPPEADLGKARRALEPLGMQGVSVAEVTADGVRLEVQAKRDPAGTQTGEEEAQLRERSHEALREAGLLVNGS